jgi:hypothetical protein
MRPNLPCETGFSVSSRRRVESLAGVAELADALVLGTSSSECGFESLRPHRRVTTFVAGLLAWETLFHRISR